MQQFDEYITRVVGSLNISKKHKKDLADEFIDHLNMMKKDLMNNGSTEEEAIEEAIRLFGDSRLLTLNLSKSIRGYRSVANTLFGIAFTFLLYLGCCRVPVPAIKSWDDIENVQQFIMSMFALVGFLILIPVGYFMPIINKKSGNAFWVMAAALVIGSVLSAFFCTGFLGIETVYLSFISGGTIGSIFGFSLLKLINTAACKVGRKYINVLKY